MGALLLLAANASQPAWAALTPESPEVRQVIDRALGYLEANTDLRLGGKCLVALAFHKTGMSPDHPRIQQAIQACLNTSAEAMEADSVYSNGLAIILLSEMDPEKYGSLIDRFAGVMARRQKPHGGWGYGVYETGDTSQTQYAVLSFWELMQVGHPPNAGTVERAANWLLRTQDPEGCWGYQGLDPGSFKLKKQNKTSISMLAAGLGSTLICPNILPELQPGATPTDATSDAPAAGDPLPAALREAYPSTKRVKTLSGGSLDRGQLQLATTKGKAWFDNHFSEFEDAEYPYYVLYSVERYKSFEDFLSGNVDEELDWYRAGFEFLKKKQHEDGSFYSMAGKPCATAFAVLFLVRSTQQSIKASLGEGTLVGGRGLSANLARMKLKNGRLVMERRPTEVDKFLEMLEDTGGEKFEALLQDTGSLIIDDMGPEDARRLEQLVRTGSPEARLLAVKALGKMRNLDYVPTLLHALTDPDRRVVRASRDALLFVSRRFEGFGPPDNFTEREQYDALEAWKTWYRRVRPNATAIR